jgi:hypothetical protein
MVRLKPGAHPFASLRITSLLLFEPDPHLSIPAFGSRGLIDPGYPRLERLIAFLGDRDADYAYLLPASAFANASLQSSLMSAVCDFMQSAIAPLPGLTSAQNCLTSALQALPIAATRMIAT